MTAQVFAWQRVSWMRVCVHNVWACLSGSREYWVRCARCKIAHAKRDGYAYQECPMCGSVLFDTRCPF